VTRLKSNVQLDYIYSNFNLTAKILPGLPSDHLAIIINFNQLIDTIIVPTKIIANISNISRNSIKQFINDGVKLLLSNKNLTNSELLWEYEYLIFNFYDLFASFRTISSHERVRGTSRQLSKYILSVSDPKSSNDPLWSTEKLNKLYSIQKADACRRFKTYDKIPVIGNVILYKRDLVRRKS